MNESQHPSAEKSWPDYRAVWRWHFYAGLFCIPFVVVLAVSGSIYLFKNEVESWIDRDCDNLEVTGHPAAAEDQIRAALAAVPGSQLNAYELPEAAHSAVQVIVGPDDQATRVYLHPESLRVLKTVAEDDRLMRIMFRLHTGLLLGNRGSAALELAASWAVIMIVTGLYLWWPRGPAGFGGVVYPRIGRGSRIFWRDIHGVTGVWISGLALFMLFSGLLGAKSWGGYFKTLRRLAGAAVVQQDRTNGRASPPSAGMAMEPGNTAVTLRRRGGVGPHAAGDRPGRGRPDRDDRPSASTCSTRAHLAAGARFIRLDGEVADGESSVAGGPGAGRDDRRGQESSGFPGSSSGRPHRRDLPRGSWGAALRLAQSTPGSVHGKRLDRAERQCGRHVVAAARTRRLGAHQDRGEPALSHSACSCSSSCSASICRRSESH